MRSGIVIDLRETWFVGPFLSVLDRSLSWLAPHWRGSTLKRGADALGSLGRRAADTRVGHLLAAVLAPPEPPDADAEREDSRESARPDADR